MIEIICRVKYPELYERMRKSAKETASGLVKFSIMHDDGQPKIAETYNLLGSLSMCDTLLFVHDDVIFLSPGWDEKIEAAMNLGFNVVGVVGSQKYEGGMVFDSGRKYSAGKMVGWYEGKRKVKLMEHRSEVEPVKVVDGMFMAVSRSHFITLPGFDNQFNGLFYYDMDLCLRSNCAVVDVLVAHEKPEHLRGIYPPNMRPITDYSDQFNQKHGFKADPAIGDQSCDSVLYDDYMGAACL